jgi:hypothetical protein
MRDLDLLQKTALAIGAAIVLFLAGAVFYTLIGFEAPQWFKDLAGFLVVNG